MGRGVPGVDQATNRLGIGYGDLSACNPRIIVVEMPAFGPGGPDSHHQGMGKTMAALCHRHRPAVRGHVTHTYPTVTKGAR